MESKKKTELVATEYQAEPNLQSILFAFIMALCLCSSIHARVYRDERDPTIPSHSCMSFSQKLAEKSAGLQHIMQSSTSFPNHLIVSPLSQYLH